MKVSELVTLLQEFPQDMPVAIGYEVFTPIEVSIKTWEPTNYPYDRPDFDFVYLDWGE